MVGIFSIILFAERPVFKLVKHTVKLDTVFLLWNEFLTNIKIKDDDDDEKKNK